MDFSSLGSSAAGSRHAPLIENTVEINFAQFLDPVSSLKGSENAGRAIVRIHERYLNFATVSGAVPVFLCLTRRRSALIKARVCHALSKIVPMGKNSPGPFAGVQDVPVSCQAY